MKATRATPAPLEELAREYRVMVAMTTIPSRIDRLEPVIDSMLRQTWPIQALYLSIPFVFGRTGEQYVIPAWLMAKKGVKLERCADMGPGTHLLNALRLERDPWSFIAVVDDDHIYGPDLVETLMRSALASPGTAIAAQGFLSIPGLRLDKDSPRYLHGHQIFEAGPVLVSYLGVVYQRGFFDDSVFDYEGFSQKCVYQDDMWFSAHLAKKGIKRAVLGAALGVQELRDLHLGPHSLTMWKENPAREVSEQCNDSLLKRVPGLWLLRRRRVLSLGGLSQLRAQDIPGQQSAMLERELEALQQTSVAPDLTYVCTQGPAAGIDGGTLLLKGFPVALTGDCPSDPVPGVSALLRSPLRWEGDPDTVIVLAQLSDIAGHPEQVASAMQCAENPESMPFCRLGEVSSVLLGRFNPGSAEGASTVHAEL